MAGLPDDATCRASRVAATAWFVAGMLLTGCGADDPPAALGSTASSPTAEAWLGRWNGPEGTWLELSSAVDGYRITVRDLDGERNFPATATLDGIRFERDGDIVELGATDGAGTGMKWLETKSDCLVAEPGEGWCRD